METTEHTFVDRLLKINEDQCHCFQCVEIIDHAIG